MTLSAQITEQRRKDVLFQAKGAVEGLVSSLVEEIAPGRARDEYFINEKAAISHPFDNGFRKKTGLLEDVTRIATQPLLLQAFVEENPTKFGLTKQGAAKLFFKGTRNETNLSFKEELDGTLVNSVSVLTESLPEGKRGGIVQPSISNAGGKTYSPLIEEALENVAVKREGRSKAA